MISLSFIKCFQGGGSLDSILQKEILSDFNIITLAMETVAGMKYLTDNQLVHRIGNI